MNTTELLAALALHQAGRLNEAEAIYRRILDRQPNHADVLHLLGVVAHQRGDHAAAAALIGKALDVDSGNADFHSNLGEAMRALGKSEEVLDCFHKALILNPDNPELLVNFGNAYLDLGRNAAAAEKYRKALALHPDLAAAHYNLGNALKAAGDPAAAIESYRAALNLDPANADIFNNLGHALQQVERYDDAIAHYRQAIAVDPAYAQAHNNLGNAFQDLGDFDAAMVSYRRAVELNPGFAEAWDNIGNAFQDRGMLDDALTAHDTALSIRPGDADIRFNRACALLLGGDLRRGFAEYECRWQARKFPSPRRDFVQPSWDGSTLDGGTVLLHAEQGQGDTLQFLRYVPEAAKRARVVIECQPSLVRLAATVGGISEIIAQGDALPDFDVHLPLMSLPHVLGAAPDTLSANIPYLRAPDATAREWATKNWRRGGARLHVGLVWAGNPRNRPGRLRSLPIAKLLPLLRQSDVAFYSLQLGAGANDLGMLPSDAAILDVSGEIRDFADTAAIVAGLDLVVSVDTAVAHLAGALGRPVWTLLTHSADWRWFLRRPDSPWYPTMRLFRQPRPGYWEAVIDEAVAALEGLSGKP
ncbi:MAG: glycosyltransferase family 41 protein [Rhodospirillaceae bacterium]|nr:glycosyltransferase family 41 protein [Rhodospirillaceae bacterium]